MGWVSEDGPIYLIIFYLQATVMQLSFISDYETLITIQFEIFKVGPNASCNSAYKSTSIVSYNS